MNTIAMEAVAHCLCYLHKFGNGIVRYGDVDGGYRFLLVQTPDMQFVDG